jgi:hypothetical protein
MQVADLPALRKEVAGRIHRLIGFLDLIDPYVTTELEEENEHGDGDADDEPSLGAPESANQVRAWSGDQNPTRDDREDQDEDGDELDKSEASDLEISGESDCDGYAAMGQAMVDDEPSLGSLDSRFSQARWSQPDRPVLWPNQDLEHDDADHEGGVDDVPIDQDGTGGNMRMGNANDAFGVVD